NFVPLRANAIREIGNSSLSRNVSLVANHNDWRKSRAILSVEQLPPNAFRKKNDPQWRGGFSLGVDLRLARTGIALSKGFTVHPLTLLLSNYWKPEWTCWRCGQSLGHKLDWLSQLGLVRGSLLARHVTKTSCDRPQSRPTNQLVWFMARNGSELGFVAGRMQLALKASCKRLLLGTWIFDDHIFSALSHTVVTVVYATMGSLCYSNSMCYQNFVPLRANAIREIGNSSLSRNVSLVANHNDWRKSRAILSVEQLPPNAFRKKNDPQWRGGFSLGVDLGLARTGIALSKGFTVRPLTVLEMRGQQLELRLLKIAEDEEVDEFIIGLPRSSDGKETPQSNKVRSVAGRFAARAAERGLSKEARQKKTDAYAAVMVLERYFAVAGNGTELVIPKQLDLQDKLRNGPPKDTDFYLYE
ncbi:Putative pre-16S rRNA nuclease, partial [Linum perenne]